MDNSGTLYDLIEEVMSKEENCVRYVLTPEERQKTIDIFLKDSKSPSINRFRRIVKKVFGR